MLCVEYLLRIDDKGMPAPWLFTSWQVAPDNKSITFNLRKGVKFHDGTDFNAEAVKYILDLCKPAGTVDGMWAVTSIDVIDNYTVRFNLSQYEAGLLYGLAFTRMVSPTALKTNGKDWCLTHPVGTGPFKFVSFQRDVSLKYEKFADYWQKGKPYLDGIEFDFIADPVTAVMAFQKGDVHILYGVTPKDLADLQQKGYVINRCLVSGMGLTSDSGNPKSVFSDIRVRQAVGYAIDREAIAKSLGFGFWQPAYQLYPTEAGYWAYNPQIVGQPYNPKKAKELLAEAGYPNGFTTKFIAQIPSSDYYVAIQTYLKEVGIDAQLELVAPATYVQTRDGGWKDGLITFLQANNIAADPGQSLVRHMSSKGTRYVSIIHPAEYEAKLAQAQAEPDIEKRKQLISEVTKMAVDQYCMVNYLYINYGAAVLVPEVKDSRYMHPCYQQWTPEDAWLSK
jgi:ABC-type transport system substrate-binding protein